jgi:hypothetical protein
MRFKALSLVVGVCVLAAANTADAAIEGYANLNIFDLTATQVSDGSVVVGSFTPGAGVDAIITGLLHQSSARGSASGFPSVFSDNGPILSDSGMSTLVAEAGPGGGAAGVSARGEDNFDNFDYSGFEPSGAGDTFGEGSIISLPGFTVGSSVFTVAEGEVSSNPLSSQSAGGNALVEAGASFVLTPTADLNINLDMTASLGLLADSAPVPPGSFASAATTWVLTIRNPDGSLALLWTPDGILNDGGANGFLPGSLGAVETADSFAFSQTVSAGPGVTSAVDESEQDFGLTVTLLEGVQYQFSISHTSSAQVITQGVIPEPGSCIVWGLLALTAGAFYRRRRSK